MASKQKSVDDHMAFMRRRKKKYKDSTDKINWETFKRMKNKNPSHSKYTKPNKSIPDIQYQAPPPKQMISMNNTQIIQITNTDIIIQNSQIQSTTQ